MLAAAWITVLAVYGFSGFPLPAPAKDDGLAPFSSYALCAGSDEVRIIILESKFPRSKINRFMTERAYIRYERLLEIESSVVSGEEYVHTKN